MTHTHTHTHPCFPPSVTPIIPISHACTLSHVAYLSHFPMSHRVSPQCISYRTMYLTAMYILPQCILPQCISYRNVNLTVSGNPHPFPHLGTQALFRLRLRLALLLRTRPTAAASEVTHLCHVSHSPIYIYIYIYIYATLPFFSSKSHWAFFYLSLFVSFAALEGPMPKGEGVREQSSRGLPSVAQ